MANQITTQVKPVQITSEMTIQEIVEYYPDLVDVLVSDYGFHCVGCFASQFETLGEGAEVHGIVEAEFDDMLSHLNSLIPQMS